MTIKKKENMSESSRKAPSDLETFSPIMGRIFFSTKGQDVRNPEKPLRREQGHIWLIGVVFNCGHKLIIGLGEGSIQDKSQKYQIESGRI